MAATMTSVRLSLKDGSVLIGEPIADTMKFDFIFGNLTLKVVDIAKFDRVGTNTVKVTLKNNDLLTGTPRFGEIAIETAFGTIKPSMELVKAIAFNHGKAGQEEGLVFSCGMESLEEIMACDGRAERISFVEGKEGSAAFLAGGQTPVTFAIPAGLFDMRRGCLEYWMRFANPTGFEESGGELNMATIAPAAEDLSRCFVRFFWTHNNGGGRGGLDAEYYGLAGAATHSFGTRYRIADIVGGQADGWHHYAMTWDMDGIGSDKHTIEARVNGKLILHDSRTPGERFRSKESLDGPQILTLANPWTTPQPPVVIDNVKVWNHTKTDF